MYEFFAPGGGSDDESLADFARRRLGKEAYEKLIDPMASGIYAGNSELLSLKSCFPKIFNLEEKYGSLIKGMIKLQKEAQKSGKQKNRSRPRRHAYIFSQRHGSDGRFLEKFSKRKAQSRKQSSFG